MPFLDVSDVLLDPDFASRFDIKRRAETVGSNGRPVVTETLIKKQVGVFTVASPNDLDRLSEEDRMGRNFVLVTKARLLGPSQSAAGVKYKPDLVVWQGNSYIVKTMEPYTQYGAGFVQAIVGSIDMLDQTLN